MKVINGPTEPGFYKIELRKGEVMIDPSRYHGPDDPCYIYGPTKLVWRRFPSGANEVTLVDRFPDE